ncbi:hypothetical protein MTO96_022472 [Rhipicephalus appendiculatus]
MRAVKFALVLMLALTVLVENISSVRPHPFIRNCVGRPCYLGLDPWCGPFCDCIRRGRSLPTCDSNRWLKV